MRHRVITLILGLLTLWVEADPLEGRVRLTTEHADLRVVFEPEGTNLFRLAVRDADRGIKHMATKVALMVPESARNTIPEGFEMLGPAGSDLWILPQSQDTQLLYLGVSGEGLPKGLIEGSPSIRLLRLEGPGDFMAWQADGVQGLLLTLNTRDGITDADRFSVSPGGHVHFNWGFTSNGFVTAWMQVHALVGGTNAWSAETPVLFAVEPLPIVPAVPPRLSLLGLDPGGSPQLWLEGTPGTSFRIQQSIDLTQWETVTTVTATGTPTRVPLPAPNAGDVRFFRAIAP